MNNLVAFFDSADLKQLYVDRVHEHQVLDQLVQGQGRYDGRGCAVACTMHRYDHAAYEEEIGVPMVLARLEDNIFEGLPIAEAKLWPLRFLGAIPVGADLSMAWPKFAVWVLREEVAKYDKAGVCERVAKLYDRWIAGDKPGVSEWREARSAAYAAAAAASAAAAADAAAAAAYAAAAAAADADRSPARHAFWRRAADKLEALLREAPLS